MRSETTLLVALSICLTKEAPGCVYLPTEQAIWTVKRADSLVLVAEEDCVYRA
jgi:hypothetical protein